VHAGWTGGQLALRAEAAAGVSQLQVETVPALEPLRQEWTELATRTRSVFKTWEWLSTWWDHFGRHRELLTTVVRSRGRPIGILPLYRWRTRPLQVLRFLGHTVGDELGPICAPADRPLMARALGQLLAESRCGLLLAEQLPADEGWGAVLGGRVLAREGNPVLRFGADGWEGFLRERSGNFREQVRRRPRKLAREHRLRFRLVDGSRNLQSELDVLFRLHAARWAATASALLVHEGFHRAVTELAAQRGWLRMWVLELDGQPAAALHGFRFAGVESYYQAGRDPRWDRHRVGFVLLAHAIQRAAQDSVAEYRLLRGGEEYKYRFATADPGLETIGVPRSPLAAIGLPMLSALRTAMGPLDRVSRWSTARFIHR
jgi:CelD/BcsL family acetyltransferase involved in cellulose biosynthesis